jgi:hypothetical protein
MDFGSFIRVNSATGDCGTIRTSLSHSANGTYPGGAFRALDVAFLIRAAPAADA